jgi:hypothetical protein
MSQQNSDEPSVVPPDAADRDDLPTWRRILAGLVGGFCYAVVLSVIALVVTSARGAPVGERPLELGAIVAGYFIGGLLGGSIVAVLWPLVTTRNRASLVTILAGAPLAKVLSDVANESRGSGSPTDWFVVAGVAIIMGLIGGRYLWDYKRGAL